MTFEEWLTNNEKYIVCKANSQSQSDLNIVEKDCFQWLQQCWNDCSNSKDEEINKLKNEIFNLKEEIEDLELQSLEDNSYES